MVWCGVVCGTKLEQFGGSTDSVAESCRQIGLRVHPPNAALTLLLYIGVIPPRGFDASHYFKVTMLLLFLVLSVINTSSATVRGMPYMEILIDNGPKANVTVWSNINSDCQPTTDVTDELDLIYDTWTEQGQLIIPNGERYYAMDNIMKTSAKYLKEETQLSTSSDDSVMIVPLKGSALSISLYQHASLPPGSLSSATEPYEVSVVYRYTTYLYESNTNFYMLVSPVNPDGSFQIFVMQTFTKQVDKEIGLESLNILGDSLKLPPGWAYTRCRLWENQTLHVVAQGTAYVISDELGNVYQYLDNSTATWINDEYPNDVTQRLYQNTASLMMSD